MDWRNAGKRTKLWIFDGSVIAPILLCLVAFHQVTIALLLVYAAINAYIVYRERSMSYVIRYIRFYLRDGVVIAFPVSYWRRIIG